MHAAFEVFALVEGPDQVQQLMDDLAQHGIPSTDLEVITPSAGVYRVADEHLHADAVGAGRGAAIGAAIGLVLAVLVIWALPALDSIGGAQWALGLFFAGTMGAVVGGMAGLQANEGEDDDPAVDRRIEAGDDARILAIRSDRWHARAHRVLERHRVVFLDEAVPHA